MTDYSSYKFLRVEKRDGIATLTLDRPDLRNAVNKDVHPELERVWVDLSEDQDVDVIIFTGAGKTFSAGGDVKGMAARAGTIEGLKYSLNIPAATRRLFQNMLEVSQPVICAINGDAVGLGATLALFSDVTVISSTARFGDSHVKVGLVAGDGGAVIWPLLIGPARAKDFLMRGKLVSGEEAHALGLVNYVVPNDDVMTRAREIAAELAALPKWAVRWTKLSVNKGIKDQLNLVLDASIAYEMLSMNTHDHGEAARAFAEKRKPDYKGY